MVNEVPNSAAKAVILLSFLSILEVPLIVSEPNNSVAKELALMITSSNLLVPDVVLLFHSSVLMLVKSVVCEFEVEVKVSMRESPGRQSPTQSCFSPAIASATPSYGVSAPVLSNPCLSSYESLPFGKIEKNNAIIM